MINEDVNETEVSLARLRKVAKVISVAFKIVFVVYCFVWLAIIVLFGVLAFFPELLGISSSGVLPFVMCIVFGLLIGTLIRIATLVFVDVAKGESPFTKRQVKRIRWVAIIFLAYAVIEMVFPSGQASLVQEGSLHVGYSVASETSDSIYINPGMLGAAIIFYCLSLVFEYGTLLQQLSDETL